MALPGQIDLNDLLIFDAVVESGNFTAAAERLGVAAAKISVEISRLESRLGTALFNRTTRKVVLTDAGLALHRQCQPLLRGLQRAIDEVGSGKSELTGTLRISSTVDHAVQSLAPALARFAKLHPELHIDLRTDDRVADLVSEGIDLSIRLGWLRDSSMRAVKLGEFEQYIVASPDYLRGRIPPSRPEDLVELDWIALTLLSAPLTWRMTHRSGEEKTLHVKSRFRVDSPAALRSLLQNGAGVSVIDQHNAQEDIKTRRLAWLLPDWKLQTGGIYAIYPPGRHLTNKVRTFIDFYRGYLESLAP